MARNKTPRDKYGKPTPEQQRFNKSRKKSAFNFRMAMERPKNVDYSVKTRKLNPQELEDYLNRKRIP